MPDAPTSLYAPTYHDGSHLGGLTYVGGSFSIDFTDANNYTLTGDALANGYSGDELTGTYTYTNSRNIGVVVLNTGQVIDCTMTFTHAYFNRDNSHQYLTTGVRYEGSYLSTYGEETQKGSFTVTELEYVAPVIEAPKAEVEAPVSAN